MSFTRAKPAGWTDDVDTITAAQINQIDVNQSRALDPLNGGTYDLTGANITLTTSAGRTITLDLATVLSQAVTLSAAMTLSGNSAAVKWRIHEATDATQTIEGARYDVIRIPSALAASRTYTIGSASPAPQTGHILRIMRSSDDIAATLPTGGGFTASIAIGGAASVVFRALKWAYLHLVWDGDEWIPVAWSPTTIDVPGGITDSWA